MALFESYERRIDKINGVLAQYGISSVEECREICKAKGFDPYEIVKGIQPICFENACWAYTVGAAIAIKSGVKTAAEAAKMIGVGLQSFCIDGSVAEDRKVGLGHGNLGGPFHRQNLNIIGSRLHAIHVQDNHGMSDEHLLPFHGNINWQEAMEGLADIDYDGDLTYEIQEFGRYFPNDQKHLVVEYSLKVGKVLVDMFEKAKAGKGK